MHSHTPRNPCIYIYIYTLSGASTAAANNAQTHATTCMAAAQVVGHMLHTHKDVYMYISIYIPIYIYMNMHMYLRIPCMSDDAYQFLNYYRN